MRRIIGLSAAFIVVAVTLTGCSSHDRQPTGSGTDTSRAAPAAAPAVHFA